MGGAVATGAADLIPSRIRRLIYLAAAVPIEGKPLAEAIPFAAELPQLNHNESTFWPKDLTVATELLYHDCDPETVRWAYNRLQLQPLAPFQTPICLPNFWASTFPRSYITCTADRSGILPSTEVFLDRLEHTDVFVRLCDVSKSGKSLNVTDGITRLTPNEGSVASEVQRVTVELSPTAYSFARGNRVRVQVSSASHPRFARNLGTGEPIATATAIKVADQRVFHDPSRPSCIVLPIHRGGSVSRQPRL